MDTIDQQKLRVHKPKIIVGMASCGLGAGAKNVLKSIEHELEKQKLEADIVHTGCIGMCAYEVLVDVLFPGRTRVTYGNVKTSMVPIFRPESSIAIGAAAIPNWINLSIFLISLISI